MQSPFFSRAIGVSSNRISDEVESLTLHDDPVARSVLIFSVPGLRVLQEVVDRFVLVMICALPEEMRVS
jgi:hypothetical protein